MGFRGVSSHLAFDGRKDSCPWEEKNNEGKGAHECR